MSSSSFSRSHSTLVLTFVLTLALASIWFLSLRPVRLKIGDYYSKHGNFDQAVRWYEKTMTRDGLTGTYNEKVILKFGRACIDSAILHLNKGTRYLQTNTDLAESELNRVLEVYQKFCKRAHDYSIQDPSNLKQPIQGMDLADLALRF